MELAGFYNCDFGHFGLDFGFCLPEYAEFEEFAHFACSSAIAHAEHSPKHEKTNKNASSESARSRKRRPLHEFLLGGLRHHGRSTLQR